MARPAAPKFGALLEGEYLHTLAQSPRHVDGEFRDLICTPMRTGDSCGFVPNVMSMAFDRNYA